jgi:hypothetical protein
MQETFQKDASLPFIMKPDQTIAIERRIEIFCELEDVHEVPNRNRKIPRLRHSQMRPHR